MDIEAVNEYLHSINMVTVFIRILLSVMAGVLIGLERGKHGRAAGLRTYGLVALGSAMSSMIGQYMISRSSTGDPTRIAAGVVSGIGFLCAGMILVRNNSKVTGLTTAAAMWATATIGLAFGAGFYSAGFIGTAVLYCCLTIMMLMESSRKKDKLFTLEAESVYEVNSIIDAIKAEYPQAHNFDVLPSKSGMNGHVTISVYIMVDGSDIEGKLRKIDHVVFVISE